jgi:hypothetical protein
MVDAAVGAAGDLAVLFVRNHRVLVRTRPRGGRWRPAEVVAAARTPTQWRIALAVDARGRTVAAWRRHRRRLDDQPARRPIEAATATRGRRFAPARTLAGDRALDGPSLTVTPEGVVAAYPHAPVAGTSAQPVVHVLAPGARRFAAGLVASPPRPGLRDVAVASDPVTRRLAVAWIVPFPAGSGNGNGGGPVEAAVRPAGGTFGPVEPVSDDDARGVRLTARAGGGFVAAWSGRPDRPGPATPLEQIRAFVRQADRP